MSSTTVSNSDAKSSSKPAKLSLTKKKIDSPLAKYNNAGQLLCIVCNTVVKSELVWTAHMNGRQHRENIVALKEKKEKPKQPEFIAPVAPAKRKHEDSTPQATKPTGTKSNVSTASGLPADFFESSNTSAPSSTFKPIKGILKKTTPPPVPDTLQTTEPKPAVPTPAANPAPTQTTTSTKTEAGPIPSGFFDDPVADAKARQVEYKDPSQEEWDKFTKEIAEAEQEARTLVEEDVEESSKERTLEEIDEQMAKLSRVINLVKKKEELLSKRTAPAQREESSSSGEEDDVSDLFDWRSKKTFR